MMKDINIAKKIVKEGMNSISGKIKDKWIVPEIEKIWAFTSQEKQQIESVQMLINNFIDCRKPVRPLCIAVFGPPGSGKTTIIEKICESYKINNQESKLVLNEINLTQLRGQDDLALNFSNALMLTSEERRLEKIPVVFFDEFDMTRNGSALGWLSWFLTPMHDSNFRSCGNLVDIEKAILVFAGGTANTFKEFSENKSNGFIKAKGPDFVSRLRGYIDVYGPNHDQSTMIRRAIILRSALKERAEARGLEKAEGLKIANNLLEMLLQVGRYRHGSRSIKAVIESSNSQKPKNKLLQLKQENLPDQNIIDIHVDRGPLDPKRIGGYVQFSCGATKGNQKKYEAMWKHLAEKLWKIGACITYGGEWRPNKNKKKENLTDLLKRKVKKLPQPLYKNNTISKLEVDERPEFIYYRVFPPSDWDKENEAKRFHKFAQKEKVIGPTENDKKKLNKVIVNNTCPYLERIKDSIRLFRMRWQIVQASVATILIGGKIKPYNDTQDGYQSRFPGIAIETALALALNKPVYLCGGFGGMAMDVGSLLGLAPYDGPPKSLCWPSAGKDKQIWKDFKNTLKKFKDVFNPPAHEDLPLDDKDLVDFLKKHAITGDEWVDNGLTIDENMALFNTSDKEVATKLIIKGFAKKFKS